MSKGLPSWIALGAVGLLPLVASCSGGADADESQPTVLESASPSSDDGTAGTADAASGDAEEPSDEGGAEEEEPEPVPASSEGPAENWPEPEIPDEIYEPTEEGAEALIQYWFDARHHARITGDVEPWSYISHEDCGVCSGMIEAVEEAHPDGWYVEDSDEILESHLTLDSDVHASGLVLLRQTSFESYWEGDLHGQGPPESESPFGVKCQYAEGRWQARDFMQLGQQAERDSQAGDAE